MLGTNLSIKKPNGDFETDTSRLLLMDMKDFNKLGIAIDDLIDAYVQTCLSTLAIDRMAMRLAKKNGIFDSELYASINPDDGLLKEIMHFNEPKLGDTNYHMRAPSASAAAGAAAAAAVAANAASANANLHMSPINLSRLKELDMVLPSPLR
jgi:hypothetical protein